MLSYLFLVLIINVLAIPEPKPEDLHIHIHGLEKNLSLTGGEDHPVDELEFVGNRLFKGYKDNKYYRNFCSKSKPCRAGQGDCDAHSDCMDGLKCGKNNCQDFFPHAREWADCCVGNNGTCKTVSGDTCIFPFTYDGKTYNTCIYKDDHPFCYIGFYYERYGDCDESGLCPIPYHHADTCKTVSGTSPNEPCKFPFEWRGKQYYECTYDGSIRSWCIVKKQSKTASSLAENRNWGYCDEHGGSCPIGKKGLYYSTCKTVPGPSKYSTPHQLCKFPFRYSGDDYDTCIYKGHKKPWCRIEDDTTDPRWGYCNEDGSCPIINEECEWLPWINNKPGKRGDFNYYAAYMSDREYKKHPKNRKVTKATCFVEKYEVKDLLSGVVYTNVSSVTQNKLKFWQNGYGQNKPALGCKHKDQKGCRWNGGRTRTGPSPPCCLDYSIRFCCKRTLSLPLRSECFSSGVLSYLAEERLNDDANKLYKEIEEDILPYVSAIIKHKLAVEITNEDINSVKSLKKFHDNFDYDNDLASEYWWTIKEKFAEDLEEIKRILRSGYRMNICPPIIVTTTPYTPHHTTRDIWDCPATWAQWGEWGPCEGRLRKKKRKCKSNCPPHNEAPPYKCTNLNNMVDPSTEWTSDPACAWRG